MFKYIDIFILIFFVKLRQRETPRSFKTALIEIVQYRKESVSLKYSCIRKKLTENFPSDRKNSSHRHINSMLRLKIV